MTQPGREGASVCDILMLRCATSFCGSHVKGLFVQGIAHALLQTRKLTRQAPTVFHLIFETLYWSDVLFFTVMFQFEPSCVSIYVAGM